MVHHVTSVVTGRPRRLVSPSESNLSLISLPLEIKPSIDRRRRRRSPFASGKIEGVTR